MHIKEKVTGLWARRPRLSGTQGRALKGVAQFFAAMLVCTLIARGTAGATLAVVQTASPRRGELVQGLTADAALSAGEVQNVKAPAGLVLEKYFVPAGGRVEADTPLAQFDPDGVKDALDIPGVRRAHPAFSVVAAGVRFAHCAERAVEADILQIDHACLIGAQPAHLLGQCGVIHFITSLF